MHGQLGLLLSLAMSLSTALSFETLPADEQAPSREGSLRSSRYPENGGFEVAEENGSPRGWAFENPKPAEATAELDVAEDGGKCLQLSSSSAAPAGADTPFLPSVDRGFLVPLNHGELVFRYQVRSSAAHGENFMVAVVGVLGLGPEEPGRVIFRIPPEHLNDGAWHQGRLHYDFSHFDHVRDVRPSLWINAGPKRGPGKIWIDDLEFVPCRPRLEISSFSADRPIAATGERFLLRLRLRNSGHLLVERAAIRLKPPRNVRVLRSPLSFAGPVLPGQTVSLSWDVVARKSGSHRLGILIRGRGLEPVESQTVVRARPEQSQEIASVPVGSGTLRFYGVGQLVSHGVLWAQDAPLATVLFSRVHIRLPDGRTWSHIPTFRRLEEPAADALLIATFRDPLGGRWTSKVTLKADPAREGIHLRAELACDTPRDLLAWEAPLVYAGERSFGSRKSDALFPGLEFLEKGEVSSSERNVWNPGFLRFVPHPQKITVPCMSIRQGKLLVGLLWDARQTWDGVHRHPSAIFSSPNTLDEMDNHLLGLFVPSVPAWVEENQRLAARPYFLAAEKPLSLRSLLVMSSSATNASSVLRQWYHAFGFPEGSPSVDSNEVVRAALDAYGKTLWVPEQNKWFRHKELPREEPVFEPHFLSDIRLLERSDQFSDEAARVRHFGKTALKSARPEEYGIELAFIAGGLLEATAAERTELEKLAGKQRKDGSWGFDPAEWTPWYERHNMDGTWVGKPGTTELGTCAWNAYRFLRHGRLTADTDFIERGLRALRYAERFRIPRGGQPWEVYLGAPDILAASQAIRAALEAYRIAEDPRYLDKAKRWADAGLAFCYSWSSPETGGMAFECVPAFGASAHGQVWFGTSAPWTALEYAYALWLLAEGSQDEFWKTVSQRITAASASRLERREPFRGLYPDWVHRVSGYASSPWINPHLLVRNLLAWQGIDSDPRTFDLRRGTRRIAISAPEPLRAHLEGNHLDISWIRPNPLGEKHVLVAGLAEPLEVRLNGRPHQMSPLENLANPGWTYSAERSLLEIALDRPDSIEIRLSAD